VLSFKQKSHSGIYKIHLNTHRLQNKKDILNSLWELLVLVNVDYNSVNLLPLYFW